jgi:hypothetical protein
MGLRLPAGRPGDEREEKVVHDRGDPLVGYPLQRHQHVVPQQRDRDRQEPAEASPVPATAGSGKIDT